jgi:hypothetical protein
LSDLIIQEGFSKGIAGGTSEEGVNQNDSEILISRCVFNKCTVAGVAIKGYNALDYWIWYCRFIQCYTGVSCNSGNYHVYNSYFNKSTQADVMNWNSYYTSVRYCYSTGSNCFSMDNGKSSNPFKRIFQHNIILNPTSNPIQYYHTGKVTLIDNYCRVPANSKVTAFLVYDTWAATNYTVLELGNTFENIKNVYTMPVRNYKVYKNKKPRSGKTDTLEKSFLSTFPTTPKLVRRKVYTVPEGATTSAIQSLINKATSLKKRAIVHFPFGLYYLEKELILNKSSDIQIIGDGLIYATMLMRRNNTVYKNGSIFKIYGPSSVSFRDLNIQTVDGKKDSSRAISIVNVDQPGSSLLLDQLYSGMDSTLTVLGYDNLFIQKTNSFFSGGNYLSGGLLQKSGKGNFGMICYAGQFANTQVRNNASFIATDCWWEGDKKKTALDYSGEGTIIIQGAMIAPGNPDSNTTAIRIGKFKGKIGLMDMYVQGKIDVEANNPDLQFLLWNINFYHKKRPLQFVSTRPPSYRSFMGGVSSQCFNPKDPDCQKLINTNDIEVNINIADAGDYIDDFILTLRSARPVLYTQKKAGISNLYFSRVAINSTFLSAIHIDKQ